MGLKVMKRSSGAKRNVNVGMYLEMLNERISLLYLFNDQFVDGIFQRMCKLRMMPYLNVSLRLAS